MFESLIVGAHALGPAELAGFAYELGALGERALIEQELRRRDEALAELESALAAAGPPLEDDRFDRLAVLTHQINNPLTSLLGRAQILQMKQREDPVVERGLSIITESAQRIAALVREVASIVRHGKLDASRLSTPDR